MFPFSGLEFFGNPLWRWIAAAAFILGGLIAGKIVSPVFRGALRRVCRTTGVPEDAPAAPLGRPLSSFLTGITEPLEFSFMFLSPLMFVFYAILAGLSTFVFALTPIRAGVGAAPGFIEFIFGTSAPGAHNPWLLILFGPLVGVVFFFVFFFLIKRLNLKTPGREDEIGAEETVFTLKSSDFAAAAKTILEGLGGAANIAGLDNCVSRLRVDLNDPSRVDDPKIKSAGVLGIIHPTRTSIQIVVGTQVQFVADAMKALMENGKA